MGPKAERTAARWGSRAKRYRERRPRGNRSYEVALASAAHEDALRPLLEIADVADLIDAKAKPPKPAASNPIAAIEVELSRVDAERSRVVLIGDTPYDVEAGRAAGIDVIGFTTGGYSAEGLAGTIAIYRGPADLLAQWVSSPLGSEPSH
ncbi:MAG TPA: HAD hydrolase-like protein [Kofleriaceae bacterium]|nr:HAD hydrolase-like protein [Kofleriaceae bacterium]